MFQSLGLDLAILEAFLAYLGLDCEQFLEVRAWILDISAWAWIFAISRAISLDLSLNHNRY